jgi:hypothetical protein
MDLNSHLSLMYLVASAKRNANSSMLDLPTGIWGFAGVILSPLIVAVVALFSRSDFQRKQDEYDYKLKRLETIQKIIDVRRSLDGVKNNTEEFRELDVELVRIVDTISETEAITQDQPAVYLREFEKRQFPWRLFFVPKQISVRGKIFQFTFYWLLLFSLFIIAKVVSDFLAKKEYLKIGLPHFDFDMPTFLAIVVQIATLIVFRALAIRTAKGEIVDK